MEKKLILISFMMAPNCSLQSLEFAESYLLQHNLITNDILDILIEKHNQQKVKIKKQVHESQEKQCMALGDGKPIFKNYQKCIYFVFKLGDQYF